MKQQYSLTDLLLFLESEEIFLSHDQQKKLEYYYQELVKYAEQHRIISRNDVGHIVSKHVFSSFYFVKQLKNSVIEEDTILDIGSGAGFPGIIISLFFDKHRTVLVDSIRKKTVFLQKIVNQGKLNAHVVNNRIETYNQNRLLRFGVITARALADLETLINWTRPFLQKGSELHTIKGQDYEKELPADIKDILLEECSFNNKWLQETGYLKNKVYLKVRMRNV